MKYFIPVLLLVSVAAFGQQEIKVEYDKNHDFTKYKTFSFGESQVTTPQDQKQISDAVIDKWIKSAVKRELEYKGLNYVEKGGDVVMTYLVGTTSRLDVQPIGPLGQTPGSNATSWSRTYSQVSLVIDLNEKSNYLVWRINSVTAMSGNESENSVDLIVEKGFKKFAKPVKAKKKK